MILLWSNQTGAAGVSPRGPEEERRSFEFADQGPTAELVAAEPEIISPVAVTWNAAGRMYVAEMRDYPNAIEGGSIRQLEDRDGDGRFGACVPKRAHTPLLLQAGVIGKETNFPRWNGGALEIVPA